MELVIFAVNIFQRRHHVLLALGRLDNDNKNNQSKGRVTQNKTSKYQSKRLAGCKLTADLERELKVIGL